MKLLDMFYFDDHVCLTLELFKATLIHFIRMPSPTSCQQSQHHSTINDADIKRPIARSSYAPRTSATVTSRYPLLNMNTPVTHYVFTRQLK